MIKEPDLGPEWVSKMAISVRKRYLRALALRGAQVALSVFLVVFGLFFVNARHQKMVGAQQLQGFFVTQVDQTLESVDLSL